MTGDFAGRDLILATLHIRGDAGWLAPIAV
jgi:hypothetical protein